MTEEVLKEFFDFIELREPTLDVEDPNVQIGLKDAYRPVEMYLRKVRHFFDSQDFNYLTFNLWLHEYIVNGTNDQLYKKYDIDGRLMIINSASNSGSSTSIQSFSSLEQGKFMLMDLWRTSYGRTAYMMLESLQGVILVNL